MKLNRHTTLSIGSINIKGIAGKKGEITHALSSLNLDILAVSETWCRPEALPSFPGYRLIAGQPLITNTVSRRGMVLYYRESLIVSRTNPPHRNPVDLDILAITVKRDSKRRNPSLTFVAGYNPPNCRLDTDVLESLAENNEWVIFGGDFNCRSRMLGDHRTNKGGVDLYQFLSENGLEILNNNEPTFFSHLGTSRIDLFFTEHMLRDEIIDFKTHDLFDSDHRLIVIHIQWNHSYKVCKTVRDYANADWELYDSLVNLGLEPEPLHNRREIDNGINNIVETLNDAGETAIGTREIPILNDYLSAKAKRLMTLRNRLRRRRRQYGPNEFKAAINDLTRRVRTQRRFDYQKFLDKQGRKIIDGPRGPAFWKAMKFFNFKNKTFTTPSFTDRHGNQVSEPVDVAEAYADYMATVCTSPPEPNNTPLTDEVIDDFVSSHPEIFDDDFETFFVEHVEEQEVLNLAAPIQPIELLTAIKKLPHKAPGKDGITPIMVKRMCNAAFFRLLEIMNECLRVGYFPKAWKEAMLVIILKPGKDKNLISSYRPISLLNIFGKLFEKVIYWRLGEHLESTGFFFPGQLGFRKHRETTELLFELTQDILRGMSHRGTLAASVLFDAEKAFDKVWTKGLLYKIQTLGIFPTRIVRLLASYFQDRKIQVRVGPAISSQHNITAGTPQGSILSPLLYNISTNDLSNYIATNGVKIRQFADDLKISTIRQRHGPATRDLQSCISKLEDFSKTWRISFNAAKTKLIVNSRNRRRTPMRLILNNEEIRESPSAKYLGMTFNRRGTATDHVNDIIQRVGQRLGFLRSLKKRKMIPSTYVLFAYKTFLRPVFEYGYPAWCGGLSNKDRLRLERIQRRAIKIARDWPLWTPTHHIYSETPIEPLFSRLNKLGRKFLGRHPDMEVIAQHHPLSSLKFPFRVLIDN